MIKNFAIEIMYSLEERVFIVLEYHRLNYSPTATRRSFQKRFQVAKGPDGKTIRELFKKFQQTGSVADALVGNVGRTHSVVTPENATRLSAIIERRPSMSVRRLAAESAISTSSTYRILRNTLNMFPYKIQCRQAVYCNNPLTLDEMEDAIFQACVSISGETLQRVFESFILRLRHVCCVDGAHFE